MRKLVLAALAAALCIASAAMALMSYKATVTVSVGTSATVLVSSTAAARYVDLCNVDTSKTLYWSWNDPAVTTATGRPLQPGTCAQWVDLETDQVLRGVTTSGTLDARVTKGIGR